MFASTIIIVIEEKRYEVVRQINLFVILVSLLTHKFRVQTLLFSNGHEELINLIRTYEKQIRVTVCANRISSSTPSIRRNNAKQRLNPAIRWRFKTFQFGATQNQRQTNEACGLGAQGTNKWTMSCGRVSKKDNASHVTLYQQKQLQKLRQRLLGNRRQLQPG